MNLMSFDFKGIVTSIQLRNNNTFNPCFSLKGSSTDGLLKDGIQRRTFVKQTLKQIYDKVLESYPQNLLKGKSGLTMIRPLNMLCNMMRVIMIS